MVNEAEIAANVEEVKRKQEARDDAEKTKEFEDMRKRNEARIQSDADLRAKLKSEKSSAERIRLRQQEEERIRMENLRISARNSGIKEPQTREEKFIAENSKKLINRENLKGAIREAVSRTPSVLDRAVTGIFTPIARQTTGETKQPDFRKSIKQESREFGKAVASAPKKPVTGGKVKPVTNNMFTISEPGDRYVNGLLGRNNLNVPRQSTKQGKQQQSKEERLDPAAPLNNLMRRLF